MSAAQQGDREAMEALLRRHHDRIGALCRRMAGNHADAEDATQEALIAIARGIHRFDGRAAFSTWAYRVATNACLDELRRRGRRPTPGLPDELDLAPAGGPDRQSPLDTLGDRMLLEPALERLPLEFRAAVVLRDVCDLDYAQIAEALGIPDGTVRSRIARGRAQLARLLGDPSGNRAAGMERPTSTQATDQ